MSEIELPSRLLPDSVWEDSSSQLAAGRGAAMIKGVHTMFCSSQPEALRAFLRDKLGFSSFTDVGDGWLIFDLPEADMGCHPAEPEEAKGRARTTSLFTATTSSEPFGSSKIAALSLPPTSPTKVMGS